MCRKVERLEGRMMAYVTDFIAAILHGLFYPETVSCCLSLFSHDFLF